MKRVVEVEIALSPNDIAHLFWKMGSDEQAIFFNGVADLAEGELPFQLQYISDSKYLLQSGRSAMDTIGIYAKPRKP